MKQSFPWFSLLAAVSILLAGCGAGNSPSPTNTPIPLPLSNQPPAVPTATAYPPLNVARIGIRMGAERAEFYNTATDERFIVRGVNYVDFYQTERSTYEDRVMAVGIYNPERVRAAFQRLSALGYNTVRIFIDTCGFGPRCIGNPNGAGLNPEYLDNMVDLLHIAGQEGIYVIYTANSVPEEGGYWSYFDAQIYGRDQRFGFEDYRNSDWLHPAGVEIKRRFWEDLMQGMLARNAPFETLLGWQLTNELWLWKLAPPLNLEEGLVTPANEQTYDMADPEQKRAMVADGILHYMETIVPIIKAADPQALTTVGFFAPQFPNATGIGGDWYVDTAPLLATAPVDFWDFHAYYDTDLTVAEQAENFGMPGYTEKPVIMGETGSGKAFFPSAYTGLTVGLQWIADSCEVGFDGWLNWGYYPWPDDMPGKPWTFLDQDGLLLEGMAPVNQPDACIVPELEAANVALGRAVRVSRQNPGQPGTQAVDGQSSGWSAGDYPPQWVEVVLDGPTTIQRVGMTIEQWPPGDTRHQVWAKFADGSQMLVAEFAGFTTVDMNLSHDLPIPLEGVTAVRFLTLKNPSWVGWKEVEVISAATPDETVCYGTTANGADLHRWPGAEQPRISGLAAGQRAVLDGRASAADGSEWWRVGGGLWLAAERLTFSGDCDSPRLAGEPLPLAVPVTFRVTVPAGTTGEIFISGEFPGTEIPAWIPYAILLHPAGEVQTVTVDIPVGAEIQYVYTRNSFENIERPDTCGETIPRMFTVGSEPMTIEDVVVKWRDTDC